MIFLRTLLIIFRSLNHLCFPLKSCSNMYIRAVFIGVTIGFALYGIYFTLDNRKVTDHSGAHHHVQPIKPSAITQPIKPINSDLLSSEVDGKESTRAQGPVVATTTSTSLPTSNSLKPIVMKVKANDPSTTTLEPILADRELAAALSPAATKQACLRMMKKYNVLPGSSWGALTAPLQQ
ncbi:hypothetical protein EON65_06385 [archaeon]|nr:MAG: hypothetical protein EON65_06385 [archaeon]